VVDELDDHVAVLLGNGNGGFQAAMTFAVGNGPRGIATGDFNCDGKPDLATANFAGNGAGALPGNGDGTFGAARTAGTDTGSYAIAAADLNGDGKLDVVTANYGAASVSVLLQ
jgi:hypothetical protein